MSVFNYNNLKNEKTGKIHILEFCSDKNTFCHDERKSHSDYSIILADNVHKALSQATCKHCMKRVDAIIYALAISS